MRGGRWGMVWVGYTTYFHLLSTRPMSVDNGGDGDELLTLANLAAKHNDLSSDGLALTPTKQPKHSRGRASRSNRLPRYSQCHRPFWPTLQSGRARGAPLSH